MYSLVVLVLQEVEHVPQVVEAWRKAGAPGATVLDCMGTHVYLERLARDDFPLIPSLSELLGGGEVPHKLLFSVVRDELVDRLALITEEITGSLSEPDRGVLFSLSLDKVVGLRERKCVG